MAGLAVAGELRDEVRDEVGPAGAADDAGLRALLRRSALPGPVRVAFTREPSVFAADGLAGGREYTVVARRDGRAVGMGRCSVHALTRNGTACRIGYLSALRVEPGLPGSARLLRMGYEDLTRRLAGRVDGCVSSIGADNMRARRILERGRRIGLPEYQPLGDLVTLVAPVTRWRGLASVADAAMRRDEAGELHGFLRDHACRTNLALAWEPWQWQGLAGQGTPADMQLVRQRGAIVAAGAVWDQRAFRQVVIDGYEGVLRVARPLVNLARSLARHPALPPPGTVLAQGAVLGASVSEPGQWPKLWPLLAARGARLGLDWLSLSRDARDPGLPILRRLTAAREYRTTVYAVGWPGGPSWPDDWDGRLLRPEAGLL